MTSLPACSDVHAEPLPGTALPKSVFVLFEWPGGWTHDILDGGTFDAELTAALKEKFQGSAGLHLIRRPGRAGRQVGRMHRCYLVWAEQAAMEMVLLTGPEKILDLDLTGPGRNQGGRIEGPLALVCTHGKRDVCCALKGRPLAAELVEQFPGSVWESSHLKGHRFAPTSLLLPWGYSFGRLNGQAAAEMLRLAFRGEMFLPANRGSGRLSPRGQVAELAVARVLVDAAETVRYLDLTVCEEDGGHDTDSAPVRVTHYDGRAWDVTLEPREVAGVISSCGDEPKTATVWEATGVAPVATNGA